MSKPTNQSPPPLQSPHPSPGRPTPQSSSSPKGPVVTEMSTQTISLRRPNSGSPVVQQIQQPQPQPNQNATPVASVSTKSYAEENPDYTSIELPSRFQFYTFKTLSARTLKGSHQAKLNRAYTQNRLRFVVEAMSATLEPSVSAFDLTPADFYFLMYWQKVNSFTKSPQIITVQCTEASHLAKVQSKDLPVESLRIEQFLNSTTLDTKICDRLDLEALRIGLEAYPIGVETMRDVVEMTETMIDMAEEESETKVEGDTPVTDNSDSVSEYGWLASRASFLDGGLPLEARLKIVGDMSVEETSLLEQYMQTVTNYGVEEFAAIRCKECGASKRVRISFDALTFLPGG